jgi:L-serine/L-threonine ammonia-lyase
MTIPLHVETPLLESTPLSRHCGRTILVKLDAVQPSGSFKIRGLGRVCQLAAAAGVRHVVIASGGNAGLATAWACGRLGIRATVVVPRRTAAISRERIAAEGAELVVAGEVWDDADETARALAAQRGARYVHPFDDPELWRGHASLVEELVAAGCRPDALVVAVGGGGLLCGIVEGLKAAGWSDVPVLAVETEGAASFARSLEAGRVVALDAITSVATTLGARVITGHALELARTHPISPVLVSDRAAIDACRQFLADHRLLVEPACGAALAVAYQRLPCLADFGRVVIEVCGGSGVSLELLADWDRTIARP